MSITHKEDARISIKVTQDALQRIVDGHSDAENLMQQRDFADWELCWLLRNLIPVLPNDLRAGVQTCCDLREQAWGRNPMDQSHTQQKTSPVCLAATDSL